MQRHALTGLSVVFLIVASAVAADAPAKLAGYPDEAAHAELDWESKLRAIPVAQNIGDYVKRLSARPHNVGSPYDKENAEWILSNLKQWGFDAHIETFYVLFPTPKERHLELVAPTRFVPALQEPVIAADPTTDQRPEQLPTYNAYSTDGDTTAPLLYVNYGVPEDYERLSSLGISAKGAIVIARYGHSWRGIKPKVAAEHGAVGCIIYSDPADDGYQQGDVFPRGSWRPRDGVQRGSVADMTLYSGDPLTPGIGATQDAKRLPLGEVRTITRIPTLPISYGDAQPLLEALRGTVAPPEWRGALPITYHLGPGPAKVHLSLKFNWDIKPIYDVIARITGSAFPDEWIIRGNHHDAWVNGAEDPDSGQAALLEEARAFGDLLKQGWKPKRTVFYCAWDGEEPGLLGSTEWAEQHADELRQHAAVYINSDANGRGYLEMEGSHTLERFVNGVAKDITDPEKNIPVWKRAQLVRISKAGPSGGAEHSAAEEALHRSDLRIEALGSGSDYTPFLQHLGIASLDLGYSGEDGGGIYHSIYDDYYWYSHFSDTNFVYGRTLAQTIGTAVMRLADADLLPYEFTDLADTVHKYVTEVQELAAKERGEIERRNSDIERGMFSATSDPKQTFVSPAVEPVPPYLNFAPLLNATAALTKAAERYQKALERAEANGGAALDRASLAPLNTTLMESERKLTNPDGLPGRPWFQHEIYAPGLYTGYAVKTLPSVREAVEQKKWEEADQQVQVVGKVLEGEAALVDSAAAQLEKIDQ